MKKSCKLIYLTLVLVYPGITGWGPVNGQDPSSSTFVATRLNNNQPIITASMFNDAGAADESEGDNINGPSVIRIPDWIDPEDRVHPDATYYMYFAHHKGNYIRMAWASQIEGPWNLYKVSSDLPLEERGVFSLGERDTLDVGKLLYMQKHVASPDVLVDNIKERFVMYFHAPTTYNGVKLSQKTYVATSPYGLNFNDGLEPVALCAAYAKIFQYRNQLCALAGDDFFVAPSLDEPWTAPDGFDYENDNQGRGLWTRNEDNVFEDYWELDPSGLGSDGLSMRHPAVLLKGDTLHVFYSRKYDIPERILHTYVVLNPDFNTWKPEGPFNEILRPEFDWEGVNYPIEASKGGSMNGEVHQIRDPGIFKDSDGSLYLFYTGQGEDAIGIASLSFERNTGFRNADFDNSRIHIYPNPVRESARIVVGEYRHGFYLNIFTISGQFVEKIELDNETILFKRKPGLYSTGIYLGQVISRSGEHIGHFKLVME